MRNVKVLIIGAGAGGLSARREVSKVTEDYLVIDGGTLGTTCARVGCMPSKVLIQVAEDFHRKDKFLEQGISGAEGLSVDTSQVMQHVRKLRDRFVRGVTGSMEGWQEEKLIRGYAKFIDDYTVIVNGEKIKAEKIIIATGTKPFIPEVFTGYEDFLITTDEFFEMESLPEAVAVIGLGVIGIELGQSISRLGVDFLGIARRRNIAGVTDPKLNEYVTRKLEEDLNLSFDGIQSVEAEGSKLKITSGEKTILADKVLVTTGRKHNLDKLDISKTSAQLNDRGIPLFDKTTFMLSGTNHLFIAGDNTGEKQLLHEASEEGRIAGHNSVNAEKSFQTRTPLGLSLIHS